MAFGDADVDAVLVEVAGVDVPFVDMALADAATVGTCELARVKLDVDALVWTRRDNSDAAIVIVAVVDDSVIVVVTHSVLEIGVVSEPLRSPQTTDKHPVCPVKSFGCASTQSIFH